MASKYRVSEYSLPVYRVEFNQIVEYRTKKVQTGNDRVRYYFLVKHGIKLFEKAFNVNEVHESLDDAIEALTVRLQKELLTHKEMVEKYEEKLANASTIKPVPYAKTVS